MGASPDTVSAAAATTAAAEGAQSLREEGGAYAGLEIAYRIPVHDEIENPWAPSGKDEDAEIVNMFYPHIVISVQWV